MCYRRLACLLAAFFLPLSGANAVNWNEAVDGDLSDDGDNPTVVTLGSGSNIFTGTMGSLGGSPLDADVWTFTIAAGYYLTGIDLIDYSSTQSGMNSFMAISPTNTINMFDPSQHLSNGLWTGQEDGFGGIYTDMLAILDAGPEYGGIGFDGPLGPGTYTFWIQEGSDQIGYTIDFVLSPVPVPEPGSLLLLGLAGLYGLRRRGCSSSCIAKRSGCG